MTLSALPAELTLNIVELLDPDSTLEFAITCEHHSALCRSVLAEHRRRLSEWQAIDTTDAGTLLWQTLKEVLEDPRKGWYVRELNLPPTRQFNWTAGASLYPSHQYADLAPSNEEKDMFKRAARKLEKLYPTIKPEHVLARAVCPPFLRRSNDLVGTIEDRIDAGIEDSIVTVLLHHLPHLSTIKLTEVDNTSDCLRLMPHRVASGYRNPIMARKLPLQHLTTAAVSNCNTEGSITADWACSFLSIPSLVTFAANEMGHSPTTAMQACYLPLGAVSFSNVTELFFMRCQFDVEGVGIIFAGIKNLKKLTYYGGDASVANSYYEPRKLIQVLEKHAGSSLEELVLDQDDMDVEDETTQAVSLRRFKELKVLNCPWYMVRPMPEGSDSDSPLEDGFYRREDYKDFDHDFDVRIILPESLEELYIHGTFFDTDGHYEWQAMERAFCAPNAMTPYLTPEKTCIRRRWNNETRELIGTADEPVDMYNDTPVFRFFCGHGFGAT